MKTKSISENHDQIQKVHTACELALAAGYKLVISIEKLGNALVSEAEAAAPATSPGIREQAAVVANAMSEIHEAVRAGRQALAPVDN
ncbi:MAG: hypothetical protein KKI02_06840, partial [Planctomycetes bacterium]|nr:hypothetical protein [Planctomycetota bacterium]